MWSAKVGEYGYCDVCGNDKSKKTILFICNSTLLIPGYNDIELEICKNCIDNIFRNANNIEADLEDIIKKEDL